MTDREKLIELLGKHAQCYEFGVESCEECQYRLEANCNVQVIADHLIANGVTFAKDTNVPSKWISVRDRLPEHDLPSDTKRKMIRCLVYTDKGTVKPCVRQRWENFAGKLQPWMWNKNEFAKPTHWMPLPEAPKEE